jgi:hypothetical protein
MDLYKYENSGFFKFESYQKPFFLTIPTKWDAVDEKPGFFESKKINKNWDFCLEKRGIGFRLY